MCEIFGYWLAAIIEVDPSAVLHEKIGRYDAAGCVLCDGELYCIAPTERRIIENY